MVSRNVSSIRWDDEIHRQLKDKAWKHRISVSEVIRSYVRRGLTQDRLDEREPLPAENDPPGDDETPDPDGARTTPSVKPRAR